MAQNEPSDSTEVETHELAKGLNHFVFAGWEGPEIPVWAYLPWNTDAQKAPILVMMHGSKRGAARYLSEWDDLAEQYGFIVVAPEFSRDQFPKSRHYNQGNLFVEGEAGEIRPEPLWSFSAIEPLFDAVVRSIGSDQEQYSLYGHSAGAQFVHRYQYLKPHARVSVAIAANAGWYTMPDLAANWPYGLAGCCASEEKLASALASKMIVLLGTKDIDRAHESLRRSDEAMQQGPHRFARGQSFFDMAKRQAKTLEVGFGWSIVKVPGVAHSNRGMAQEAARWIRSENGKENPNE